METERIRYIYEIRNKVNGHTYIGQHTLRKGRTFETDIYYGSGVLINKAQRKYGLENFEKIIIISGSFSKEQINRFERCMIACQKICGKAEYNLAKGGDGGDLSRFIDYSKVGKSICQAHKDGKYKDNHQGWSFHEGMNGKFHTEKTKQLIREANLGCNNPNYGKKQSNEVKQKVKETRQKNHLELFDKIEAYLRSVDFTRKDFPEIGKSFGVSYKTIERVYKERF